MARTDGEGEKDDWQAQYDAAMELRRGEPPHEPNGFVLADCRKAAELLWARVQRLMRRGES